MFNSSLCINLICSWVIWYVQCKINMQLSLIGRLNLSRGLGWNVDLDLERKKSNQDRSNWITSAVMEKLALIKKEHDEYKIKSWALPL